MIASVLKPVDDVRAYWKLSQSIAKTNKYEVNIIGNATKKAFHHENIITHPHELLRTEWIKRIFIREKILWKILHIKPKLLIITTPELLNVALLSRMLTGCRIIYDVQENYYLNGTRINPTFPKVIYGLIVRLKELLTRPFIAEYWLAEACYERQLNFVSEKHTIVENKAFGQPIKSDKIDQLNILFSGTISSYAGVEKAVDFYKVLIKKKADSKLNIIGQVHDLKLKEKLESEARNLPGLQLNISLNPIPYSEILTAIQESNLGIIGYTPTSVNREKTPTKLYEYSRYKLPYLVQADTHWSKIGEHLGGAIAVDFNELNVAEILKNLSNSNSLFTNEYPHDATWEKESEKITTSLDRLTK